MIDRTTTRIWIAIVTFALLAAGTLVGAARDHGGAPSGLAQSSVAEIAPALAPHADAAATPAERDADEVRSYGRVLTGGLTGTLPSLSTAAATVSTPVVAAARAAAPSASATTQGGGASVAFPRLSSRPGSSRTLYLSFTGTTVSGTGWNGGGAVTVRPYDTDGRPGTWSAAEAAVVTEVWRRVVEDYAPYDLNVTTVAPAADQLTRTSASDQTYGATVIVSNETFYVSNCQCGGIAYTGGFDMVGNDKYNEAWVFTRTVGKGARNIAEAITHESGHTLGLSHDGDAHAGYYEGQGPWAPIMGSAYSRPISQFSRGEYAGASNRENDLAVLAQHGLALRADEAGSTPSTAIALSRTATRSGIVATASDVDTYRVSLSRKKTTINVSVAAYGPNLDVLLVVRDAAGRAVASANPPVKVVDASRATGLAASLTFTPAKAGTYYVSVRGAGYGTAARTGYSSYGSTGSYAIRWTS